MERIVWPIPYRHAKIYGVPGTLELKGRLVFCLTKFSAPIKRVPSYGGTPAYVDYAGGVLYIAGRYPTTCQTPLYITLPPGSDIPYTQPKNNTSTAQQSLITIFIPGKAEIKLFRNPVFAVD